MTVGASEQEFTKRLSRSNKNIAIKLQSIRCRYGRQRSMGPVSSTGRPASLAHLHLAAGDDYVGSD